MATALQIRDAEQTINSLEAERDLFKRRLAGSEECREKLFNALCEKDKAMGVLFERLAKAGVDCSDLIP